MNMLLIFRKLNLIVTLLIVNSCSSLAIIFNEVSTLHVWITISSLASKDPHNTKALIFRQVEINWINAPLDEEDDYIGLYLDSQPDENVLPVAVYRLNNQLNGQIITDYYLPQVNFYNESYENEEKVSAATFDQDDMVKADNSRLLNGSQAHNPLLRVNAADHLESAKRLKRFNDARYRSAAMKVDTSSLSKECVGYCLAYHSRNKILASNCLKTNPTWMHDIFQYISLRSLLSLMIPGTHNSGTYPLHLDKNVLNIINKYQINQDESIFNQLVYGIRHLDLRVGYSKVKHKQERLWIYHDIFRTEISVIEVLQQVKKFLDMTTHEFVIVDFHRFTVGFQNENLATQRERHAKLIELLFDQLGQYIIPSYLGQHAPLSEYLALGKRLIIGYANRNIILGSQAEHQPIFAVYTGDGQTKNQVRDIDAVKQDQEELPSDTSMQTTGINLSPPTERLDRLVGTTLYNKLKSLRLISNSFSKRSIDIKKAGSKHNLPLLSSTTSAIKTGSAEDDINEFATSGQDEALSVSRAALFFPPVRHLWANKDTLAGLAQYMNETTCRKYFGELRSMMAEMTPTVFGVISDKYDGNRKLAETANRPVTDWIRDRWLHCINIVATDFFLGNDLIQLSIYANKMRVLHQDVDLSSSRRCSSFRKVENLLDKSKIPIQFSFQHLGASSNTGYSLSRSKAAGDTIMHTSSDGKRILLKPLIGSNSIDSSGSRERRESFVENISDGFTNLFSSFKRLINL